MYCTLAHFLGDSQTLRGKSDSDQSWHPVPRPRLIFQLVVVLRQRRPRIARELNHSRKNVVLGPGARRHASRIVVCPMILHRLRLSHSHATTYA